MKKVLLLILIQFMIASCNKDENVVSPCEDQLPAITTTGANTFGCCINGNLLVPRSGSGTFGGSDYAAMFWGDPTNNMQYSEIDIKDFKSKIKSSILIHIQNLHQIGVGDYIIDQSNGQTSIDGFDHNYMHCKIFDEKTNSYQYYRSFDNSGLLKISRFDYVPYEKLIVSGTFSGKVRNSLNPSDEIEIIGGRFDLNGATLLTTSFP